MAELTIRVRTPLKVLRIQVPAGAAVSELRTKIAAEMGTQPGAFKMSLKPDQSAPLKDIDRMTGAAWPNGAMVYVDDGSVKAAAATVSAPAPAPTAASSSAAGAGAGAAAGGPSPSKARRQLTARCTHGPNGACGHCLVITDEDMVKMKDEPLNKVARFAPRHAAKAAATAAAAGGSGGGEASGDLEWLCRHRPDQMCVNCAPLKKGDKVEHLEMLCQHGPGGKCTNCLPPDSTVTDRKFITYAEWDKVRRARCEHAFNAVCVNCTPPSSVSYKLKPGCAKHRPWPGGLCSECAPPLADLKHQPYRHVDYVQFNNFAELEAFINLWTVNEKAGVQRAAWMYGYTAPDPNYPSGTKAVVEALYEPPQVWDPPTGAIRIMPDPRMKEVDAVAGALGLRRIGWMFTKKPFDASKEGILAPRELQAMCALQNAFPQGKGLPGSQFVTVVVRRGDDGMISPSGFMASDQMQALVRDGVTADAKPSDVKVKVKTQGPGDPPVPEVILSSNLRGRQRGVAEFDVEIGLVTLETGGPHAGTPSTDPTSKPRFKHYAFPVENRKDFGVSQAPRDIAKMLATFKKEPTHSAIADFHCLAFLSQVFDVDTAVMIAGEVARGGPISDGHKLMLESVG